MEKTPYQRKLAHPDWQRVRLEVMKRDNFKCQKCGSDDKELHIHHRYYSNTFSNPQDYPLDALITLCYECHEHEESVLRVLSTAGLNRLRKVAEFADDIGHLIYCIELARNNGVDLVLFAKMSAQFSSLPAPIQLQIQNLLNTK